MEPIIVVRDARKGFGVGRNHVPILRGISLEVLPGETLYLVGPSGSGKTTLLSLMGCILSPDSGSVRVLGHEMAGMRPGQLTAFRKRYLSFVFQSFNLFPSLSALDNVRLMLCMRGVQSRAAATRAEELLKQVGLAHRARLRPTKLSTGECQRVAIARALANEPLLLLADEPTASLDAENGQSVMRLIKRMTHDRGVSLVIVTHDDRILPFADRILRLEDGQITREEKARGPSRAPIAELPAARTPPPPLDLDRRPSHVRSAARAAVAATAQTAVSPPAAAADATQRIVVGDEGACSPFQIVISNQCAPSLVTEGIIVSCAGDTDSGSDPGVFEAPSEAPLASETAAVRS
jgi:putative ABC transport system ATP-binding protein